MMHELERFYCDLIEVLYRFCLQGLNETKTSARVSDVMTGIRKKITFRIQIHNVTSALAWSVKKLLSLRKALDKELKEGDEK
jgi:hypothetical protein